MRVDAAKGTGQGIAREECVSEAEPTETPRLPEEPVPAKPRSGRGLAALALFLALLACGGSGGIAWLWWQSDGDAAQQQAALQEELASLRRQGVAQEEASQDQINALREQLQARLAELQQAQAQLRNALASAASQASERPIQPGSWRTAEAEYLLRIANHRLLMERDPLGAQRLLSLADEILAQVDGFAYHDVRILLANELVALRDVRNVDVQGVFLRLQALRDAVGKLPLRLAEYTAGGESGARGEDAAGGEDAARGEDAASNAEASADAAEPSLLDALLERLTGLVRFRRHDGEQVRPLLAPRQADYLELRLGLALDRAQLAALRFDQGVYRASLNDVRRLLARYVDTTRPQSIDVAAQLHELAELEIAAPLPDISASLARLVEIRQARTAQTAE